MFDTGAAVAAGHSLGAAVASLAALQLLKQLPHQLHSTVASIGFAGPAFGNAALAAYVEAQGWSECFTNYLLPGDASSHFDCRMLSWSMRSVWADLVSVVRTASTLADVRGRLRAEDVIPRLLSSIAPPTSDAESDARLAQAAAAALLPTILEGNSLPATDGGMGVTRLPLGVLSNVQPFASRRFERKPAFSDAALPAVPQPVATWASAEAQITSTAAEPAMQQRSPRLAWARMVAAAPQRAVQAARTAYVPLGRQVWLPPERLESLAETLQAERAAVSPESAAEIRVDAGSDSRRSPALKMSRSLLSPPAHRMPSYRCFRSPAFDRLAAALLGFVDVRVSVHGIGHDRGHDPCSGHGHRLAEGRDCIGCCGLVASLLSVGIAVIMLTLDLCEAGRGS